MRHLADPVDADPVDADARLLAVATRDPFDVATFSGLSARLFGQMRDFDVDVVPVASRALRWHDALTGAIDVGAALGRRRGPRGASLVRADWYWSRAGFERFSRRFDRRVRDLGYRGPMLQVGTHVVASVPGVRPFCITDCTVEQALAAGEFSVSRADGRIAAEAIACQREVFASCEKVFTLSRWAGDSVVADYGIAPERVVVVGAGANVERTLPRRPDRDRPMVLFVGFDWEQKGGPLLVEAFRTARRRVPSARLVVVGCRPTVDEPGVEVVGPLRRSEPAERERLLEMYATATCLALCSRFDAFPNVVLEAGLCGLPVVATAEGSRSEAVLDGRTGLLAERRDPAAVAEALVALLADPDRAEALGHEARDHVHRNFTWPVVTQKLMTEMGVRP
jgi:glycosyltransferase involved in cell wall biosynthesis